MDELSSVLGEVLRALGVESPERVRPPRGSAEGRRSPGDCDDVPADRSGG
ncbi:MAG TPA: hypothetical protein VM890_12280 [Longimicrobium sp.]|jgi:hypothetical protein|nr:hypothetical protein [Longimicrobium sp.]